MRYLRNLGRRRVRTTLTILGITIGIWALVVFGSMANKINAIVVGGSAYYTDKVILSDASAGIAGFSTAPMSLATADKVREIDGVAVVVPTVALMMSEDLPTVSMGTTPTISGQVAGADQGRETFKLAAAEGRLLTAEDEGSNSVVLGSDIARRDSKHAGDSIELRGSTFQVVGVLEPTLTAPDQEALLPLRAAQRLYVASLPPLVGARLAPSEVATSMVVYPGDGVDPEALATRIKDAVPGVATMTGAQFDEQIGVSIGMLNSILIGIALISLVVGGLSVINTMAMSIAERTREIGIKRAIGGSRSRIVRELVIESGVIGLIGGIVGLVLGALVVFAANEAGRSSGTVLFELTLGTAVTAVAFATILGALAGLVPALHAARLDPVAALRYE